MGVIESDKSVYSWRRAKGFP